MFGNNADDVPASSPPARTSATGRRRRAAYEQQRPQHGQPRPGRCGVRRRSTRRAPRSILPRGSTVLFAGLYWGARRTGGTDGSTTTNPIRPDVAPPARRVHATGRSPDARTFGPTTTRDAAYQQFADVTGLVQGPAPASTGAPTSPPAPGETATPAGRWSSSTATRPRRCATSPCSTGSPTSASGSSETITIAGFLAPLTGTVDTRVGMVAYEGDRGIAGDEAFLERDPPGHRPVERDQLLQRHQRPRRHQRHDPAARRRQHARVRHQATRRAGRDPQRCDQRDDPDDSDVRALLRRGRHDRDRALRPRLHTQSQGGDQPRRARSGAARATSSSTRSRTSTPA